MTKFKAKNSKFYPIEDDYGKLSDKYKEKIPSGVRIYGEKVDKVYNIKDWIEEKVFDDIKHTRNIKNIPNFWKSLAHSPETLERTWNNLKQIMKSGALDPVTKELIYVAVSITNSCEYCIKSHTFAAKKKGATDQMLKEMIDVVGIANQNNKLVESYQVQVDKIYK